MVAFEVTALQKKKRTTLKAVLAVQKNSSSESFSGQVESQI